MADTAARLALTARRNEVCRFTITVTGINLTGVVMAMQVRLGRDVPGVPLIQLATVSTLAAEGLKLDSVTTTGGIPTSVIKGRINQATMADATKVPYAGEVGDDTVLAYAMVWTLDGDTRTRLHGDFIVQASAYNSDDAPTNRPLGYGAPRVLTGSSGGALTFGDQIVKVSIGGVEELAPVIAESAAAAAAATAAAETLSDAAVAVLRFDKARLYGGGSAPAWLRLLWLAQDDGWAHLYDPTNPETRITATDADGVTAISSVGDGMGTWMAAVQANGAAQPQLWEGYFGGLSALGFTAIDNDEDVPHFLKTASNTGVNYPFFVMIVGQYAGTQTSAIAANGQGAFRYLFDGRSPTGTLNSAFLTAGNNVPAVMNARGGQDFSARADLPALGTPIDHDAHVWGILYGGAASKIYQDGVVVYEGDLGNYALTGFTLGAPANAATREKQWHGAIGAAALYVGTPPDAKIARMTALLRSMIRKTNFGVQLWMGGGETDAYTLRASVGVNVTDGTYRLAASRYPDMRDPIIGEPGVLAAGADAFLSSGYAQMTVTGLRPGTQYYTAVHAEGQLQPWPRGKARTPALPGTSFSCAFGSCEETASNHAVFDAIGTMADTRPLQFFMHLGDHGYRDYSSPSETSYLFNLAAQHHHLRQARLIRNMRMHYIPDDHDSDKQGSLTTNADPNRPHRLALLSALKKRVPLGLADASAFSGFYSSWQEGRVLFVATDCRTIRTAEATIDNSSKSMLGAVQKAWLKARFGYAKAQKLAVVWFNGCALHSPQNDSWNVYQTERREIVDYIKALGMVGRVAYVAGDLHNSGIDSGVNGDFATGGGCPIPQFIASPLDKATNALGPTVFSEGAVGGVNGQFGVMDVADDGGSTLGIQWTAYRTTSASDPTLIQTLSYAFTMTLP
jgi:hypothetical protein